ncbi:hypothetical protein DFH06DRAFT_1143466 [Mycena polygramma]|nr:hypothetical protein DFH06DRAFT_1143466 [Mycena polygramma]
MSSQQFQQARVLSCLYAQPPFTRTTCRARPSQSVSSILPNSEIRARARPPGETLHVHTYFPVASPWCGVRYTVTTPDYPAMRMQGTRVSGSLRLRDPASSHNISAQYPVVSASQRRLRAYFHPRAWHRVHVNGFVEIRRTREDSIRDMFMLRVGDSAAGITKGSDSESREGGNDGGGLKWSRAVPLRATSASQQLRKSHGSIFGWRHIFGSSPLGCLRLVGNQTDVHQRIDFGSPLIQNLVISGWFNFKVEHTQNKTISTGQRTRSAKLETRGKSPYLHLFNQVSARFLTKSSAAQKGQPAIRVQVEIECPLRFVLRVFLESLSKIHRIYKMYLERQGHSFVL